MKLTFSLVLCFAFSVLLAQETDFKQKAKSEFEKEHYSKAIEILEEALPQNPNDAEIYFLLGFYNHYLAYDSRPLKGYNFSHSEKIFQYLDKAIELNPDYGDAKYFYGAECSANAFAAMQNRDADRLKEFYRKAFEKGAYPPWLLEYGMNMLNQCEENAILFAGGNADFDVCSYLQLNQGLRKDITLIPIGFIDRPWYVLFLKVGLQDCIRNIDLSLTQEQIFDLHPYKWESSVINIFLSEELKEEYGTKNNLQMEWVVEPNLFSDRMHSKTKTEQQKNRNYLSPQKAILIQIVEDNINNRPIYFSHLANTYFLGGLDSFCQNAGLVSRLTPIKTFDAEFSIDIKSLERLLQSKNLVDYKNVRNQDIPRISSALQQYHQVVLNLAHHYYENNDKESLENLRKLYESFLMVDIFPDMEQTIYKGLENMLENL